MGLVGAGLRNVAARRFDLRSHGAVDIGGTKIVAGAVTDSGQIISRLEWGPQVHAAKRGLGFAGIVD